MAAARQRILTLVSPRAPSPIAAAGYIGPKRAAAARAFVGGARALAGAQRSSRTPAAHSSFPRWSEHREFRPSDARSGRTPSVASSANAAFARSGKREPGRMGPGASAVLLFGRRAWRRLSPAGSGLLGPRSMRRSRMGEVRASFRSNAGFQRPSVRLRACRTALGEDGLIVCERVRPSAAVSTRRSSCSTAARSRRPSSTHARPRRSRSAQRSCK
jgi:hypothetical protein